MRAALLIDGGYLRAQARRDGFAYNPDFIAAFAGGCLPTESGEQLARILYYDCPLYRGVVKAPVSGKEVHFSPSDKWLEDLAARDLFAVRLGTLAFRGWIPKRRLPAGTPPTDDDFRPNFEQKGVDMRIGLDIATLAKERAADRLILVTADTDMIPAMKHARKSGLQVIGIQLPVPPALPLRPQFLAHVDFKRAVGWPALVPPHMPPDVGAVSGIEPDTRQR